MPGLKIGIAAVDYTPPVGLPLMGNFRDDYAARGKHDPLFARALVFEDSAGSKAAVLALDICMLDADNVAAIRRSIASRCNVPPENVLVAATHSHSAPAPMRLGSLPKADDRDVTAFLEKAAGAVPLADANLADAALSIGFSTESRLSFNRRLLCRDGTTHMNWEKLDPAFVVNPLGPIDPQVITLSVEHAHRPRAAIVNFALHPAILAGDNWLYSADYPGYLAQAMSRIFEPDFVALFLNGCCGNVNHIDFSDPTQGRGYQMTQRIGYMLAVAAQEAMKTRQTVAPGPVRVSRRHVPLERLQIDETQRRWCETVLENAKKNPTPGLVDGVPEEYYARARLDMALAQNTPAAPEVMVIRIGDAAIVGLPGEIFCEYGMDIKARSCARHTLVVELANDAVGYIPTPQAFKEGGYESTPGTTMFTDSAGRRLVDSALAQIQSLFEI